MAFWDFQGPWETCYKNNICEPRICFYLSHHMYINRDAGDFLYSFGRVDYGDLKGGDHVSTSV